MSELDWTGEGPRSTRFDDVYFQLSDGLAESRAVFLDGCGLLAAPCRVVSAGLKILPVIGHVAAASTDACAQAIDP